MDYYSKTNGKNIILEKDIVNISIKNKKNNKEPDSQLEAETLMKLQQAGWECELSSDWLELPDKRKYRPDITLKDKGNIIGYVECYNPRLINSEKVKHILFIVEHHKPQLFIVTDGNNYEVYFDGKYRGTMSVIMSYDGFSQMRRFNLYANKLAEAANGKNK